MKKVKMDKYALIQLVDSAMHALRSEFIKQNTEKGSDGLRITPFGAANSNECADEWMDWSMRLRLSSWL